MALLRPPIGYSNKWRENPNPNSHLVRYTDGVAEGVARLLSHNLSLSSEMHNICGQYVCVTWNGCILHLISGCDGEDDIMAAGDDVRERNP